MELKLIMFKELEENSKKKKKKTGILNGEIKTIKKKNQM